MSSIELELEEEEEKSPFLKELSTESQSIKELLNLNQTDLTELLLKIELEEDART